MDLDKEQEIGEEKKIAPISVVAALGNPGLQYYHTRHNIAWQMIEYLSFFSDLDWKDKFHGDFALYRLAGEAVYFIKPMTYMNLSGKSLGALMKFYQVEPGELLVIHDDLEFNFGVAGFKRGGGLAGHNGLRSTAGVLGTQDFNRLRMGIGRPAHKDITSYVLGPFSKDEQILLPTYLEEAAKLLEECLLKGFGAVEKTYRKKVLLPMA